MQIIGLKIRAVNIPLIKPYTISLLGEVTTTRSVIVEVFTDQGLVGIGETDPELMFTGESQQTVMTMLTSHLGPAVLGIFEVAVFHGRRRSSERECETEDCHQESHVGLPPGLKPRRLRLGHSRRGHSDLTLILSLLVGI